MKMQRGVRRAARELAMWAAPTATRFVPPLRQRITNGVAVFTFHDVGDNPSPFQRANGMCTPVVRFREQVAWIESTFEVVPAEALIDGRTLPERPAVITFDDGWAGIFESALPHLGSRSLPALIFLNGAPVLGEPDLTAFAASIGVQGWPTPASLPVSSIPARVADVEGLEAFQGRYATEAQVAAAARSPLVALGSHLFRHWVASSLTTTELVAAHQENEAWLDQVGGHLPLLAFPYGKPGVHYGEAEIATVMRLGSQKVFSSLPLLNGIPLDAHLHRTSIVPDHDGERALWWATYQLALRRGSKHTVTG